MMAKKKPFSIRITEELATKFRAMAVVVNKDLAELFEEVVTEAEVNLTKDQQKALKMLLTVWKMTEEDEL